MEEGWLGDDYLIWFDGEEVEQATDRYELAGFLPGYAIVGLRGWDDFIVRDDLGALHTVPTVPIDMRYLERLKVRRTGGLERDARCEGKIKWYITPIVFSGDPLSQENIVWLSHEEHAKLVIWWNDTYRATTKEANRR